MSPNPIRGAYLSPHSDTPSAKDNSFEKGPANAAKSAGLPAPSNFAVRSTNSAEDASEVFLTEHDLAARHQRSVKTIRNLRVRGGYIPFAKIGRHVRYRLSDVLAFEEKSIRTSTSDHGGGNA